MEIGIIGGGTVGSALAHAFSTKRPTGETHTVLVYDKEPGRRTAELGEVVRCGLVFICLPEKAVPDQFAGLSLMAPETHYVVKSTVPVGTTRKIAHDYMLPNVYHSPEFLTARTAKADACNPRVNVVGTAGPKTAYSNRLVGFYQATYPGVPVLTMSSDESEAVKLFMNSFFGVKVAFWNECRALADKLGLNWDVIRDAILFDKRVHPLHTQVPGPDGRRGFGGACLPKDLKQLIELMFENKTETVFPHVCRAAYERNLVDRKA